MKKILILFAVLCGCAGTAQAQLTFPIASLPWSNTLVCDPPTPADLTKVTYIFTLDNNAPSAPLPTCEYPFTLSTVGVHHFSAAARYQQADGTFTLSTPATLDVTIVLVVTVGPPANLRLKVSPPALGNEVAAPFTDAAGHLWTLVGTDPRIDGAHAGSATSAGTELLLFPSGVYIHGTDNMWYRWTGTNWSPFGPAKPTA